MADKHPQHRTDDQAERALLARTPDVIAPGHTYNTVTDVISHTVLSKRTPIGWFLGFGIAFILLMILNMTIGNLLMTGIGIWGNNIPVGWAFDIINFVWWIGIGHAGTLISAILLLFRQQWRTPPQRASCSPCCTPAVPGWRSTGCSRTRTRWACGRSSAAR
jgi:molybdopterin-containing oxidoreductase family membrane subunit